MEKVVLGFVTISAAVVIAGVHIQQTRDRNEMHKGVLRDKERLLVKRNNLKLANTDADGFTKINPGGFLNEEESKSQKS